MIHNISKFRLSDGKAMLASALQSVRNFDRRSRYLLTLVALLAMTTGAWADPQEELLTTITATEETTYSQSPEGFAMVTLNNIETYIGGYGWLWGGTVTVAPASDDYTITRCVFKQNSKDPLVDDQAPFTATITMDDGVYAETSTGQVIKDMDGITSIEVYGYKNAAGPEVSYNTQKTEASFEMPAYDATVSYELVRDLAQGVAFSGLPEGDGCILKKDGDKYTFATTPEITLVDGIDPENPQPIATDGITLNVYPMVEMDGKWMADEDATPVALADFLASPQPGNWTIKAVAAEPSAYDGTFYSKKFTLAEAYDLTLSPATDANLKSVTVDGTAKTADEKGVIKNIEPTKKVKITTTGPDYIIRKAAVKKTENMKTLQIGGETTATIYYIEGESWTDAIKNHPTENAGWKAFTSQITYDGSAYVLFYGGSTTTVNPGEKIDSTKTYKLES